MKHFIKTFIRANGYRSNLFGPQDHNVLHRHIVSTTIITREMMTIQHQMKMKVYHGPVICAHSKTIPYLINANSVKCRYLRPHLRVMYRQIADPLQRIACKTFPINNNLRHQCCITLSNTINQLVCIHLG